jgi:hypothetical protein
MQTNEFFVRTGEARLQKFMRHVSPPPPANVQIRGGECVYRWAEKLGFVRALWLWSQYSIDFVLRRSLPSAAANAKAIKRASGAIERPLFAIKAILRSLSRVFGACIADAQEMSLLSLPLPPRRSRVTW